MKHLKTNTTSKQNKT